MSPKTTALAGRVAMWVALGIILVFVALPALVVLMTSINPSDFLEFPPQGFSLRWYEKAITYPDFQRAFQNGLIVTACASFAALIIGSAFAYVVDRYDFRGKGLLEVVLASPLIIPHFTTGFGFLLLGGSLHIMSTFITVVAAHVCLVTPFVIRSVYVSLRNVDINVERSAANLGAPPRAVLFHITLPLIVPGLVGGWMFAAMLSFTEFTASLFVTVHKTQTLPVAMYAYIRQYNEPTIAAISAILILATSALIILANRFLGLNRILSIRET